MTETQAMSLRERLTRAICQEQCAFYGEPSCWDVAGGPSPRCDEPGCQAFADAALSIALEEAARVVERWAEKTFPAPDEEAQDIAAAIRALKDAK